MSYHKVVTEDLENQWLLLVWPVSKLKAVSLWVHDRLRERRVFYYCVDGVTSQVQLTVANKSSLLLELAFFYCQS